MYSMCAERTATDDGTTLLWHALDRNGDALCARIVSGTAVWTPDTGNDRDEYCRDCMNAVAMAFRPGPRAAGGRAAAGRGATPRGATGGGAVQQHADLAPPDPELRPHGQ
ncbi:hypothetical protein RB196_30865 [Streptomyces sp. PmtA]|uniref:hypothetical protein n=1 Tax=Streptomyces sp. PmtA TaxID=3074275 RepID=UPI00301451D2